MYPTLEPFSAGFDKIDLSVVPSEGERPAIQRALYEDILYWSGEVEAPESDVPMLLRYPRHGGYFEVTQDQSIPADQIELPEKLIRSFDLERIPSVETFLVTKPEHAKVISTIYS